MIKNPTTGIEIKWDVLVMENLFYDRKTTRVSKISKRKEKPVY
jgi:1-phosphatidylinositol-3-phosphate 5-kinase